RMPMPIDLVVVYEDESAESFYIPNTLMRWSKENPYPKIKRTELKGWDWAYPTYTFSFDTKGKKIKTIIIDPSELMADVDKSNNLKEL
ncbi:MAG: M1 family peptidase, partial [Myroides sp.]|nr:M1 family peptidase [Myroides sp.]